MAILNIVTDVTGLEGVLPAWVYIDTTDTVAEVTTAGYLNASTVSGNFNNKQVALVNTSDSGVIQCDLSISAGIITLVVISISGNSVISAGSNGVAGVVNIYPATANRGYRHLVAANNSANYVITETNASFGQSTTITTPDPATATANNVIAPAALANGKLVMASGTAGLVADSTIVATNVQLKSGIKAVQDTWAGGGASHGFTVAGVTTSSVAVANVVSAANASEYILATVCTANTVTITFSSDPGAVVVNIIAFIAAQ